MKSTTFTKTNSVGERLERVANTPRQAIELQFAGWKPVEASKAAAAKAPAAVQAPQLVPPTAAPAEAPEALKSSVGK